MKTVVRPILDGKYTIDTDGRLFSVRRGRQIGCVNGSGYVAACLSGRGPVMVHRLVAETFIPNPRNLPFVNHLNGDKADNRVFNLEWTDAAGNNEHALRTGLTPVGSRAAGSKMTEADVERIFQMKESGYGIGEIANEIGCSRSAAYLALRGIRWKHVFQRKERRISFRQYRRKTDHPSS